MADSMVWAKRLALNTTKTKYLTLHRNIPLPQPTFQVLYCHLPFCRAICPFCAFAVHSFTGSYVENYLAALTQEATMRTQQYQAPTQGLRSVYFGGGTPSTCSLRQVEQLLNVLRKAFPFAENAEICFELNPEDVTPNYVMGLTKLGITRMSLGAQSFNAKILKSLGRVSSAKQVQAAAETLAQHGSNFNLDLMLGAPGILPQRHQSDVQHALTFSPPHLSLYLPDIEPKTPWARTSKVIAWRTQHEDALVDLHLWATTTLESHGLVRYEVSNFAQKGHEGLQNQLIWRGKTYLGLGLGAHSYIDTQRFYNTPHLKEYLRRINARSLPTQHTETLSNEMQASEALMIQLRTCNGLNFSRWQAQFALAPSAKMLCTAKAVEDAGYGGFLPGGNFHLTPQGLLLADEIACRLATAQFSATAT